MMSYKYERDFMKRMKRNKNWIERLDLKARCLSFVSLVGLKSILIVGKKFHWISDNRPIKSHLARKYIAKVMILAEYTDSLHDTVHYATKAWLFTMNRFNERVKKQNAPRFKELKGMCTNAQ